MRIAILLTCFNRVAVTLRGLEALFTGIEAVPDACFEVFLVDDASPDDTGLKVRHAFPKVNIVEGTGSLFWNRGMCLAYQTARATGSFDAYLLFNDDVVLVPEVVKEIVQEFRKLNAERAAILVGPMHSEIDGSTTYTGMRQVSPWRPMTFDDVMPNGELQACDTFNGNFVLVPGPFFEAVGGLDPIYHHAFGDIDLGLTAKECGVGVLLWRRTIGVCERHPPRKPTSGLVKRFRQAFFGLYGIRQHYHIIWKHSRPWHRPVLLSGLIVNRIVFVALG